MKLTLAIFFLSLLITSNVFGQNIDCTKFKNGYYKIESDSAHQSFFALQKFQSWIHFVATTQGNTVTSTYFINWLDDCTFTLRPIIHDNEYLKRRDFTLIFEIIETKENSYILKKTSNLYKYEIITEAVRIDSVSFEKETIGRRTEGDIKEQIKVAQSLREYLSAKHYEKAIDLFSMKKRKEIRKIQNNEEDFHDWCWAWTLDENKYQRYITRIKSGQGNFIFENGKWRIDEK